MKYRQIYEVVITPNVPNKFWFLPQVFITKAYSSKQAELQILKKYDWVNTIVNRDYGHIVTYAQEQKTSQKTSQNNILEFLDEYYYDIKRHELQLGGD
jgi:phage pi2 protein 07